MKFWLASMRPRRARLGCGGGEKYRPVGRQASMRPRRARLGCLLAAGGWGLLSKGFNEAEARAPRMPRLLWITTGLLRGFNEAEARAPRMPATYDGSGLAAGVLQ